MDETKYELVVFDGDETLIDGDVISALAEYSGVTSDVERIKADVWQNDLDAMEALEDHIFPLFEGVSTAEVDQVVRSLRPRCENGRTQREQPQARAWQPRGTYVVA